MHTAMTNALALMSWHELKILHGDFTGIGSVWLLIGLLLAFLVISALAAEAALILRAPHRLRSRFNWPPEVSESTVTMSPSEENLNSSDTAA